MSQGNANRIDMGVLGSSGTGDTINFTIAPLDTRWDIVPESVLVYVGDSGVVGWKGGTLVAKDDGAGNFVGQGAYADVFGTINYIDGSCSLTEVTSDPFNGTNHVWVEIYERFPSGPADDFDFAYMTDGVGNVPLVLHRVAHSSFADKNLTNHGSWAMLARKTDAPYTAYAEFLLKDPDFNTDRPIMSEIAIRGNGDVRAANYGPRVIQRCESLSSADRTGYRYGYCGQQVFNHIIGVQGGQSWIYPASTYNEFWNAVGLYPRALNGNNIELVFEQDAGNDLSTGKLETDDWHIFRLITSLDVIGVHLQLQLCVGYAEVDKAPALRTFVTLGECWHRPGDQYVYNWALGSGVNPLASGFPGFYGEVTPHAYPPTNGRQGFVVGGGSGVPLVETYFDAFRCFRMPEP